MHKEALFNKDLMQLQYSLLEVKPITYWERLYGEVWKFNHIEDGHVSPYNQGAKPTRDVSQTKNWANAKWRHYCCHMVNGSVVKEITVGAFLRAVDG